MTFWRHCEKHMSYIFGSVEFANFLCSDEKTVIVGQFNKLFWIIKETGKKPLMASTVCSIHFYNIRQSMCRNYCTSSITLAYAWGINIWCLTYHFILNNVYTYSHKDCKICSTNNEFLWLFYRRICLRWYKCARLFTFHGWKCLNMTFSCITIRLLHVNRKVYWNEFYILIFLFISEKLFN